MSDVENHTFMGIPILGEITDVGVVQRTEEEFAREVKKLLDFPLIASFGWRQYTPYFNDGEPCTFRTNTFWVRTTPADPQAPAQCARCHADCLACGEIDEADNDRFELDSYSTHPVLGGRNSYRSTAYVGEHEAEWTCANNLRCRMENGEYNSVLLRLFGDHAMLTVTREKILRTAYDHD